MTRGKRCAYEDAGGRISAEPPLRGRRAGSCHDADRAAILRSDVPSRAGENAGGVAACHVAPSVGEQRHSQLPAVIESPNA